MYNQDANSDYFLADTRMTWRGQGDLSSYLVLLQELDNTPPAIQQAMLIGRMLGHNES